MTWKVAKNKHVTRYYRKKMYMKKTKMLHKMTFIALYNKVFFSSIIEKKNTFKYSDLHGFRNI